MNFKIGVEAEGIYTGLRTLFVVGTQQWEEVLNRATHYKVAHIYLGANKTDPGTMIELLPEDFSPFVITAEVEACNIYKIPTSILCRIRIMVRVELDIEMLGSLDMIKIDTGRHCYITTKCQMITNEINYLDEEVS